MARRRGAGVAFLVMLAGCTSGGSTALNDAATSLHYVESSDQAGCVASQVRQAFPRAERVELGLESSETASEALSDLIQQREPRAIVALLRCLEPEALLGQRIQAMGGDFADGGCVPDHALAAPDLAPLALESGPIEQPEVIRPFLERCASDLTMMTLFGRWDAADLAENLVVQFDLSAPSAPSPHCVQVETIDRIGLLRVDELAIRESDLYTLSTARGPVTGAERAAITDALQRCDWFGEALADALATSEPQIGRCAALALTADELQDLAELLKNGFTVTQAARLPEHALMQNVADCTTELLDDTVGTIPERTPEEHAVLEAVIADQLRRGGRAYQGRYERACAERVLQVNLDPVAVAPIVDGVSDDEALDFYQQVLPVFEESYFCSSQESLWSTLLIGVEIVPGPHVTCLAETADPAALEQILRTSSVTTGRQEDLENYLAAVEVSSKSVNDCVGDVQAEDFNQIYSFRGEQIFSFVNR